MRYYWAGVVNDEITATTTRGFEMTLPSDDMEIAPKIYSEGQYDSVTCKLLSQHLNPGDTALDVGANIGQMTLVMADAVGEMGDVVAFKPDEYNRYFLKKNVDNNSLDADIQAVALGETKGKTTLVRHESNKGAHSTTEGAVSGENISDTVEVDVVMLDSLELSPDLIKIDTEGGEPAVLSGGMKTISNHLPILCMEVDPEKWQNPVSEVIEPLIELNYKFKDIYTCEQLSLDQISDGNRRNIIGSVQET